MIKTALDESVVELKVMPTACRAIAQEGRHIQGGDKRTGHSKTGNTKSNPVEANTELGVKQNNDGRYSSDQRLMRFRGGVCELVIEFTCQAGE